MTFQPFDPAQKSEPVVFQGFQGTVPASTPKRSYLFEGEIQLAIEQDLLEAQGRFLPDVTSVSRGRRLGEPSLNDEPENLNIFFLPSFSLSGAYLYLECLK
jgi:hypothetical protein